MQPDTMQPDTMQPNTMQPDTITLIAQKAELPKQAISEAMEWLVLTWSGEESAAE